MNEYYCYIWYIQDAAVVPNVTRCDVALLRATPAIKRFAIYSAVRAIALSVFVCHKAAGVLYK